MKYIQKNLMPNEKILYKAQVSPFIFLAPTTAFIAAIIFIIISLTTKETFIKWIFVILAIMFFLETIGLGIKATIIILVTELAITNRRIIAKTGLIHQNTLEILLPKIESVNIYQNILGKLINFGNVTITGTGGTKGTFKAIIDPEKVRTKINQIIEHYSQIKA